MRDPDGVYLACNEAHEHAVGARSGGVVGRTDAVLLPPQFAAVFRSADAAALDSAEPFHSEVWLDLPGLGAPRLFEATQRGLFDADGRALGTVGIARDITEQYRLEQALQDRVKELQSLYAVFRATEDLGRPLQDVVHEIAVQLPSGFRRSEVAEARIRLLDAVHATAERPPAAPALVAGIDVDGRQCGEIAVWCPPAVGLSQGDPAFDEEDRRLLDAVARRLAVFLRGRRAEADLARYREHLEQLVAERTESLRLIADERAALFDAATAGIVLLRERRVVRCNRSFEELLGYGPGELEGRSSRTWFIDDETFLAVGRRFEDAMAGGGVCREEHELVRKDGSRVWCRLSARMIDPSQPALGIAGMIDDISLERAALAEMARARQAAEEAARAKSDFLANMSHEIRTPMNAIIGMSHLIAKAGLTPRQRDYLTKIQAAGDHLLGIIDDILDFSKAEAGKLELDVGEFELEKMLANVTALVSGKAGAKGLELVVDVGAGIPGVLLGDELRIRQVLLNFCSNAVKFTERGEITLSVRQLAQHDDAVELEFAVRDTGIGLSAEQKDQLFQSFQQADSSTSRKYGGTGLGLVISRRLVELMQGEIGCDSTPGIGSTFWFRVRLQPARRQPRTPQIAPAMRGLRILVVDDNATARTVLRHMLARMGFVVDEAASGGAALECLRQAARVGRDYAVVFLDWRMPDLDGLELTRRIRALGLERTPRCVLVSAYAGDELAGDAKVAGVDASLLKPVNASVLFDTLMELMAGTGVLSQEREPPAEPAREALALESLRGARVLLVEDNELNQEVARAMLTSVGLIVDVAENGEVAVRRVQEASYDLVFMDMQMPVMDGLTATREIRRLPGVGLIPIVAMTANVLEQDRERCLEAGMNDYLGKPIVPALLWACLERWVKPRDRPPQAVTQTDPTAPVAAPAAPLDIDGLDAEGGLRRVAGNLRFYLSLLDRFVDRNRQVTADIGRMIEAGDHAGAQHLAHALKGAAGTLGAVRVQAAAGELESVLHLAPDAPDLSARLATLGAELVALFAALERELPRALADSSDASPAPSEAARRAGG
jgi:two-component system sensor histidine kinase/response regulator